MKNYRAIKTHFINSLIWRGCKVTAENFFVSILFSLKAVNSSSPIEVFYYSILSLRPLVSLRLVKVGSVTYRTPAPISTHHRRFYAIKFLLHSSKDSRGLVTVQRITDTLNRIFFSEKNAATDKKMAVYREAIANRSFTRFIRA